MERCRSTNCLVRTGSDAVAASDAFGVVRVAEYFYIHLAHSGAGAAGGASVLVHRQAVKRDAVEEGVESTQRAEPFTEWTVKKDG